MGWVAEAGAAAPDFSPFSAHPSVHLPQESLDLGSRDGLQNAQESPGLWSSGGKQIWQISGFVSVASGLQQLWRLVDQREARVFEGEHLQAVREPSDYS